MKRVLTSVVAAGTVVVLAAGPAGAQTKVRTDARGDAPSRVDIRSAKVQNNASRFAVTVRVADVVARRTSTDVVFNRPGADRTYLLRTRPVSGGRYAAQLVVVTEDDIAEVACRGARVDVGLGHRGFVRTVVPQTCLGDDAGRQEVYVSTLDKQIGAEVGDQLGSRVTVRRR